MLRAQQREVSASVHDRTATNRTEHDIFFWTAAKIGPLSALFSYKSDQLTAASF
jgi:hypothetical protein